MSEELLDIEELRREALQLGIKFQPNLGATKLKDKIDAYYASQETSEKEIIQAVKAIEQSEEKSAENDKQVKIDADYARRKRTLEKKAAANKTKVVTIMDNDQRVNGQTTTCKVTCANMYFDLGSAVFPLNLPIEIKQGHLDVLNDVQIPQHVKNPKTGLSEVRLMPKYTIRIENINQ